MAEEALQIAINAIFNDGEVGQPTTYLFAYNAYAEDWTFLRRALVKALVLRLNDRRVTPTMVDSQLEQASQNDRFTMMDCTLPPDGQITQHADYLIDIGDIVYHVVIDIVQLLTV